MIYGVSGKEREGEDDPARWIDSITVMMSIPLEGLKDLVENRLSRRKYIWVVIKNQY